MTVFALAAGGTAGHIEPAIATALAIIKEENNAQVFIIGTLKGLEVDLVPQRGLTLELIPATPLPRSINFKLLTLPIRLLKAKNVAKSLLTEKKVDCVIGFGAYVSLPVYFAAKSLSIPIIIHEGNKKAGIANRLGSRFAKQIYQMFDGSIDGAITIGMPLRQDIKKLNRESAKKEALEHFNLKANKPTLLVFGGSQGASSINKAISEAMPELDSAGIQVLHALGKKNNASENALKFDSYHHVSYFERMDLSFAVADLVVSRAGAMTIAEQSALGIPAIYIPFAVGNGEQVKNVSALINDGGGEMILDNELNGQILASRIKEIILNKDKLSKMSQAAIKHGKIDADVTLAKSAIKIAHQFQGNK